MLKYFFGEIKQGRLQRLQYFYCYIMLLFFVLLATAVFTSLYPEEGKPDELQAAAMALTILLYLLVSMNITAKRFRDIGLPGWWTTLVLVVVGALLPLFVSGPLAHGFGLLTTLALFFTPSSYFNKKQGMESG